MPQAGTAAPQVPPLNVFPRYQAVGLLDSAEEVRGRTVETEEIKNARRLAGLFCDEFTPTGATTSPRAGFCISVYGDYGTGKTHLLLDSLAILRERLGDRLTTIRLVSPEDTPSAWFRAEPNPLQPAPMQKLISDLYNDCGATVAEKAPLTAADGPRIRTDATVLFDLILESRINASVVEEEFQSELRRVCGPNVPEDVRNALAALASNANADDGLKWLLGGQLTDEARDAVRVKQGQAGDAELAGILIALAALHNRLNRPFALVIDELEHFADYDKARSEKRNLTWLKRLMEAISPFSPFAVVSGHKSAWELDANLIERFPERIRMVILSPAEAEGLLRHFLPELPPNFDQVLVALLEATGGKVRDFLRVCSTLWDESNGFRAPIDPARIRAVGAVGESRAIEEIQGLLQERGYTVRRPGQVGDIEFGLVGARGGKAEIVFEFGYQITQESPQSAITRFLDKVTSVSLAVPKLLACMVAEGNTDSDLRQIAQSTLSSRVRYFDSKTHDMLAQVRRALDELGTAEPESAPSAAEAILTQARILDRRLAEANKENDEPLQNELRKQRLSLDKELDGLRASVDSRNSEFEKRLAALEVQRRQQYDEIRSNAAAAAPAESAVRGEALANAVAPRPETVAITYANVIAEYSSQRALRITLAQPFF